MKLTKILAMLLALCMILCCFAACNSSDEDDDDEDEKVEEKDKDGDEEEDEGKDKDEDEDQLVGKWGMIFDFSGAMAEMQLGEKYGGDTPLTSLSFVLEWEFTAGGEYCVTAIEFPDEDQAARFYEILLSYMIQEYSEDEIEAMIDNAGYDNWEEYVEDTAESLAVDFVETMRDEPEFYEGEYEVDGDVITLDGEAEITYNIYKNEMTFEKVKDENGDFDMFEAHALYKN